MFTTVVIDGHPNPDSLTAALAQSYCVGHGKAKLIALRDLDFDLNLRFGYRKRMEIEPDLQAARDAIHQAQRIVVVTPMWWGSVPALLKGFFDRALLPQEEYIYPHKSLPTGLLKGRSGRLFLLADTPRLAAPFIGTHAVAQITRHTLKFCGIRPIKVKRFLGVRYRSPQQLSVWIDKVRRLGEADFNNDGVLVN